MDGSKRYQSVAIWYSQAAGGVEDASSPELDLHINLWKLGKRRNGIDITCLDIGLALKAIASLHEIKIYFPFTLRKNEFLDLGETLAVPDIAAAIFNDGGIKLSSPHSNVPDFSIQFSDGTATTWCRKLRVDTDVCFEPSSGGTVITLNSNIIANTNRNDPHYFRFRVSLGPEAHNAFYSQYHPVDRWFSTGFDQAEVVDFRLNEMRNLPASIVSAMTAKFDIRSIQYFLIRDVSEKLALYSGAVHKIRTLEPIVWTAYLRKPSAHNSATNSGTLSNAIIYHWRTETKEKFRDFSALSKFELRSANWGTIIISVVIAIFIAFVCGILSNLAVIELTGPTAACSEPPSSSGQPPSSSLGSTSTTIPPAAAPPPRPARQTPSSPTTQRQLS